MNIDGKIAELILRTQNASDGGKNISYFKSQKARRDNLAGYAAKDKFLLLAINMIARNNSNCNWKYAVVQCNDFYNPAFIVYFQTNIDCEKVQISFHSFNSDLQKYLKKSFRIKWDSGYSRESAEYAYSYYTNGQYS